MLIFDFFFKQTQVSFKILLFPPIFVYYGSHYEKLYSVFTALKCQILVKLDPEQ